MVKQPEDTHRLVKSLGILGLTKYESLVYLALLGLRSASATEIHEISSVPRASVYPVLTQLVQKNLVQVSGTMPKRFRAISPDKGIDHLLRGIKAGADEAMAVLDDVYQKRLDEEKGKEELIWNLSGSEQIARRLKDLFLHAESGIRILGGDAFLTAQFVSGIRLVERGVPVRIITVGAERSHIPATDSQISVRLIPAMIGHHSAFPGGIFLFDTHTVVLVMESREYGYSGIYSSSKDFFQFFSAYWDFTREYSQPAD